jgi:hypothetical protein
MIIKENKYFLAFVHVVSEGDETSRSGGTKMTGSSVIA